MSELDRQLKFLHSLLARATTIRKLRELGWFDFRLVDHPDVSDPLELATEAFLYLAITSDGTWNEVLGVITAIVAFLTRELRITPTPKELAILRDRLLERPSEQESIRNWFQNIYGD